MIQARKVEGRRAHRLSRDVVRRRVAAPRSSAEVHCCRLRWCSTLGRRHLEYSISKPRPRRKWMLEAAETDGVDASPPLVQYLWVDERRVWWCICERERVSSSARPNCVVEGLTPHRSRGNGDSFHPEQDDRALAWPCICVGTRDQVDRTPNSPSVLTCRRSVAS